MTNCYILLLLLLVSFTLHAQISKGTVLLGGQLNYSSEKSQAGNFNQHAENGTFGISAGKAFKENSVAGINFTFTPIRQTNNLTGRDTVSLTYNRYNMGVFFREYRQLAKDLVVSQFENKDFLFNL